MIFKKILLASTLIITSTLQASTNKSVKFEEKHLMFINIKREANSQIQRPLMQAILLLECHAHEIHAREERATLSDKKTLRNVFVNNGSLVYPPCAHSQQTKISISDRQIISEEIADEYNTCIQPITYSKMLDEYPHLITRSPF